MTDNEILELIRKNSENIDLLYDRHNEYCLNMMYKMSHNTVLNKEIFVDSVNVFYEKIIRANKALTCSIQTYLNSVCINQVLVRLKKNGKFIEYLEGYDERITDWLDDDDDFLVSEKKALSEAMEKLNASGGKCYEIIRSYFYEKKTLVEIADEFGYTNEANARNQKSRCQKRLKELVFGILKK